MNFCIFLLDFYHRFFTLSVRSDLGFCFTSWSGGYIYLIFAFCQAFDLIISYKRTHLRNRNLVELSQTFY